MNDRARRAERARKKARSPRKARTYYDAVGLPEYEITPVTGGHAACSERCNPTYVMRMRLSPDVWQVRCMGGSNCYPSYELDDSARERTRVSVGLEPWEWDGHATAGDTEEIPRLPAPRRVEGHIRHGHRRAA